MKEIEEMLPLDQTEFRLPPEQWRAFCERLDEPAKVIPALDKLFGEAALAHVNADDGLMAHSTLA